MRGRTAGAVSLKLIRLPQRHFYGVVLDVVGTRESSCDSVGRDLLVGDNRDDEIRGILAVGLDKIVQAEGGFAARVVD